MTENRLNGAGANGMVPVPAGGVRLDSSMLLGRVLEIMGARMSQPFVAGSPVSEQMQVSCDPKTVDVDVMQKGVEMARWSIVETLRARGIDPDTGEFSLDKGMAGQTERGVPACVVTMWWRPREEKPLLSMVATK